MALQYYTDKNATLRKREVFNSLHMPNIIHMNIDKKPCTKRFLGFGAAITGASCYLLNEMSEEKRTEFLKDIYTSSGLNLSVGRLTIGASDYSAESYTYDDVPFDTELKFFSIKRDEKYIIPMIKEILKIRPDLYIFASPWSPPGWMKTGGAIAGGFMREEFIECYAEYFIKYLKAYEAHGIHISAVTPQNEPETHQKGKMPACMWHPEIEAKFVQILYKRLTENNINTKIWLFDHNFNHVDRILWQLDTFEYLKDCIDGVAFHYYEGSIEDTLKIKNKYPNLKLHFTEGGPRLYDNYSTDWCKWGIMTSKVMNCGYSSMTGWNLLLDETGGPNIGPFFCGGLVTLNSSTGEMSYSGQYKAFRHISPYITDNSKIYSVKAPHNSCVFGYPGETKPIEGFLVDNSDQKILILLNPNDDKKQVEIEISEKLWYIELLPDTISTIEI